MCQPLFAKRHDILNGVLEVEEEEETAEEKLEVPELLPNAIKNNKEDDDDDDFKEANRNDYDIGDSFSKAPRKASTSLEYDSRKKQNDAKFVELVGEGIKLAVAGIADEIRDLTACLSRGIEISTNQMRYNAEIIEKQLKSTEEIGEKQRRLMEKLKGKSMVLGREDKYRASYLIGQSDNLINVFYSIPDREKNDWVDTLLRCDKNYWVNTLLRGEEK